MNEGNGGGPEEVDDTLVDLLRRLPGVDVQVHENLIAVRTGAGLFKLFPGADPSWAGLAKSLLLLLVAISPDVDSVVTSSAVFQLADDEQERVGANKRPGDAGYFHPHLTSGGQSIADRG